ncbi:C6 zinc finger domain-containing protein [Paraphaeosphaeria minitans]|uniref:C6 zinc finger domain-containing protein n=1 Tax=Paraphaeosphaeria minitans TaxID=565426 RepID=A0A9P6GJG9_9PLEO|nr:C6 zinc finger domain-containing protein [Paraphaeosphaeria minitans]
MGHTLRRSCAACAKSKLGCDLRLPRCSRCEKRNARCVYANEPLTGLKPVSKWHHDTTAPSPERSISTLTQYRPGSLDMDPFDSYPQTRLPREHVQRLIHGFLHKIAFQYYPLDLSATSNPFLVSWWPLALGDPALFHVSLQTACLDEELWAQKGFQTSELLMADSVALLRRKVEDTSLAIQDGTMNSVITLAAIEFGKGNLRIGEMHVDGVKRLVNLRGGINAVRQTSPLTARMVSWVSMLITRQPQFETQDDFGTGSGIPPIPEWQLDPAAQTGDAWYIGEDYCDKVTKKVFMQLNQVFRQANRTSLQPTRLHDLASFVIHRLLAATTDALGPPPAPYSECIRYALVSYMFILQGPTYYSHAVILRDVVTRYIAGLEQVESEFRVYDEIDLWLHAVGLVASSGTAEYSWFARRTALIATSMALIGWEDVIARLRNVLWLNIPNGEAMFRPHWDEAFRMTEWTEMDMAE